MFNSLILNHFWELHISRNDHGILIKIWPDFWRKIPFIFSSCFLFTFQCCLHFQSCFRRLFACVHSDTSVTLTLKPSIFSPFNIVCLSTFTILSNNIPSLTFLLDVGFFFSKVLKMLRIHFLSFIFQHYQQVKKKSHSKFCSLAENFAFSLSLIYWSLVPSNEYYVLL